MQSVYSHSREVFKKYLRDIAYMSDISSNDRAKVNDYLIYFEENVKISSDILKKTYHFLLKFYHPDVCSLKSVDPNVCSQEIIAAYEDLEKFTENVAPREMIEIFKIRIRSYYVDNALNDLQENVNFTVESALNDMERAKSVDEASKKYENFVKKYVGILEDFKTKFFGQYKIASSNDFEVDISMSTSDIIIRLEEIRVADINAKICEVTKIFEFSLKKKFSKLGVLLDSLKNNYISIIKDDPISIEELSACLSSDCNDIKNNYDVYLSRVNAYETLSKKAENMPSLHLKKKIDSLRHHFYDGHYFYETCDEVAKLMNLICNNKVDAYVFSVVTKNYSAAVERMGLDSSAIKLKSLYDEAISRIMDYGNNYLGIDSVLALTNLFTENNDDVDLLDYVSGRKNNRGRINPDLIRMSKGIFGEPVIYSYFSDRGRDFFEQSYTNNILERTNSEQFLISSKGIPLPEFLSTAEYVGYRCFCKKEKAEFLLYKNGDVAILFDPVEEKYSFRNLGSLRIDESCKCHDYFDDRYKVACKISEDVHSGVSESVNQFIYRTTDK